MGQSDTDFTQTRENGAPAWLVVLAKSGYAARGLLYVLIGSLAFLEATGNGGESTDSKGALDQVLQAPGGFIVLWLIAASLVGYSAWRLVQSILDADDHGTGARALLVRSGLFVSALTHLALAYTAGKAAWKASSSGGGSSSEGAVAVILGWPGGPWIVAAIGIIIGGAGVAHILKAIKEKYKKHFAVDSDVMSKLNFICKFGLLARGFVFFVIAGMFIYAAITQDSDRAGGLKDVLDTVSGQVYGPYLLGALAIGLLSFGVYSSVEAMYRKIDYKM